MVLIIVIMMMTMVAMMYGESESEIAALRNHRLRNAVLSIRSTSAFALHHLRPRPRSSSEEPCQRVRPVVSHPSSSKKQSRKEVRDRDLGERTEVHEGSPALLSG